MFGYELEDIDTVGGADVYNGQQSVLWKNLREMFPDELKAMYQQLRSTGAISYDKVEQMFEDHQSKWSEAIFNEDAWFKYLAPLEEKNSAAYLSMLQGSKAEQRKWWLYNRFKYLDSKYNAGDSLTDVITLRGYAKSNITITPYADIYATIKFGSYLVQQRAERKQSYELICPLDNVNDTEIYIYSASQLADVGDLSGLKVGYAEFVYATKLQHLKLGDDAALYQNNNLQTLYLGQNTLLKTLDVRNCYALGTGDQKSVDLSGCTNIEEVYFDGTQVKGVTLPNGGVLKKLHLPETVTNITIRNQPSMTELECPDYSNVSTLWLDNPPVTIDTMAIVDAMEEGKQSRVRLFNFHWEMNDLADVAIMFHKLQSMSGIDQNGVNVENAQVYGTIHVPDADGDQVAAIQAICPDVRITFDHVTSNLRYYSYDGSELLHTEVIRDGANGTWNGAPTRTANDQYSYTFIGWSTDLDSQAASTAARQHVTSSRNVYAAYQWTVNTYTVTFVNSNGSTLQTISQVPYGGSATYAGSTPTHPTDPTNYEFVGFLPYGTNITGNTTCVAKYRDVRSLTRQLVGRWMTETEDDVLTAIGSYAFAGTATLQSVTFPEAVSISQYAFYNCASLADVSIPKAKYIGGYAFTSCGSLKNISLPAAITIGTGAFQSCTKLSSIYIPNIITINSSAFMNCGLSEIELPNITYIGDYAFSYCLSLKSASFTNAINLRPCAFMRCSRLTTISIPNASYIGYSAFQSCTALSEIDLPKAVWVGQGAFYTCSSLTTCNAPVASEIYGAAFYKCSNLTSVNIPEVTYIYYDAFYDCRNLETIDMPMVSHMSYRAFYNCYELKTVRMPAIQAIESSVFQNCSKLQTVVLASTSMASLLYSNAFANTGSAIIYVNDSLVSQYKSATNWSYYASRVKGISELPA